MFLLCSSRWEDVPLAPEVASPAMWRTILVCKHFLGRALFLQGCF
jgi:hypothetical protein